MSFIKFECQVYGNNNNHSSEDVVKTIVYFQELDASNKDPVPVIIVGNKVDLADKRAVSYQEGQRVRQTIAICYLLHYSPLFNRTKY